MYWAQAKVKLQYVLQSESAELREALADARKEVSHVQLLPRSLLLSEGRMRTHCR